MRISDWSSDVCSSDLAAERSIAKAIKALDSTPAAGRDLGWMQARSTVRKAQLELADLSDDMPRVQALAERLAKEVGDWPAEDQTSREAELDRAYAAYYRASFQPFDGATLGQRLPLFRYAGQASQREKAHG